MQNEEEHIVNNSTESNGKNENLNEKKKENRDEEEQFACDNENIVQPL